VAYVIREIAGWLVFLAGLFMSARGANARLAGSWGSGWRRLLGPRPGPREGLVLCGIAVAIVGVVIIG
jgi:H+/Cl- antiporter ClcA